MTRQGIDKDTHKDQRGLIKKNSPPKKRLPHTTRVYLEMVRISRTCNKSLREGTSNQEVRPRAYLEIEKISETCNKPVKEMFHEMVPDTYDYTKLFGLWMGKGI